MGLQDPSPLCRREQFLMGRARAAGRRCASPDPLSSQMEASLAVLSGTAKARRPPLIFSLSGSRPAAQEARPPPQRLGPRKARCSRSGPFAWVAFHKGILRSWVAPLRVRLLVDDPVRAGEKGSRYLHAQLAARSHIADKLEGAHLLDRQALRPVTSQQPIRVCG